MSMSFLDCCVPLGIGKRKKGQRRLHEVRAEIRNYFSTIVSLQRDIENNGTIAESLDKSQMIDQIRRPTPDDRGTHHKNYRATRDENNNRIGSQDPNESVFVDIPLDDGDDVTSEYNQTNIDDMQDRLTKGNSKKVSIIQKLLRRLDWTENQTRQSDSEKQTLRGEYETIKDSDRQRDSSRYFFKLFRSGKHGSD